MFVAHSDEKENSLNKHSKRSRHAERPLTVALGGGRFSGRPVGADTPASQPLAVHRGDGALRLLKPTNGSC